MKLLMKHSLRFKLTIKIFLFSILSNRNLFRLKYHSFIVVSIGANIFKADYRSYSTHAAIMVTKMLLHDL